MIRSEFVEDNFAQKLAPSYKLSILIGVDSFAYMVSDLRRQILVVKEFVLQKARQVYPQKIRSLEDIFAKEENLGLAYRQVLIGLVGEQFTLLPDRLYNPEEKRTYLRHLTESGESTDVLTDHLVQPQARLIYQARSEEMRLIKRQFPDGHVFNLHSALLESLRPHAAEQDDMHLYCHVRANYLHIFLFDRTNLQFVNSFNYRSAKDFIYYLLLVFDQFDLDLRQTPLFLCGQLVEDGEIYQLVSRYASTIEFLKPTINFQFGPKLSLQPAYFYYDLLSIAEYPG